MVASVSWSTRTTYKSITNVQKNTNSTNLILKEMPFNTEFVTGENFKEHASSFPMVTSGELYPYLSSGVQHDNNGGTFRSLTRGYKFWASGRIQGLQMNTCNPHLSFAKAKVFPSMKQGMYEVSSMIDVTKQRVESARCKCVAG